MRGKEGDFFSSCKPFQLCSGLRTETGRERESSGARSTRRKKERKKGKRGKKRNRDCVALCFILEERERERKSERERERTAKEKSERGSERVLGSSAGEEGEDAACEAKRGSDWSWEGCLGLCPLDTVPRLAACLPGWSRIQPPAPPVPPLLHPPPPPPPFSVYPQMPSFTPASPPPRSCLLSIRCTSSPPELWMI